MKISEIMSTDVQMVQPDDPLPSAAKKMRDQDIGFLPVCDGGTLLGVLSDRDITIRALAEGIDASVMLCRDLMTTPPLYCFDDQNVREAAKVMEDHQVRRLVILERDTERVVGIISLGDLARHGIMDLSGKVLEKVSEPDDSDAAKNA